MSTYPKTVKLSGGGEITVRPAVKEDEQALHEFFCRVPQEDRLFLKHDVTDRATIRGFMSELSYDRIYPLTARHGDEIVGHATLHRDRHGWSRHVAEVRIVVTRGWQRKGVGTVLMHELIEHASQSGVDLVEALVLEGDRRAQRALEQMGFRIETTLRERATDRTGRRCNILVMVNETQELWRRMDDLLQCDAEGASRRGE
ncbi:MAG: N-acetyltransferase [Deltaproteobacteria bacterium]|nr:N-acetyltransferase [Deltaproteobacteria bacterium]